MSDPFYYSPGWRRIRASFLRTHPMCYVPGCDQRAVQVDHQLARKLGGAEFDFNNLRGCCLSHHSQLTGGRDGGFGNARNPNFKPRVIGADRHGNPLSPDHHWNR